MDVAVIIPLYKTGLTGEENMSLARAFRILGSHPVIGAVPESLGTDILKEKWPAFEFRRFPDSCFTSVSAYNRLVLSEEFYSRFQDFGYILIYQLDAYVFSDELDFWAGKGYDYIGAPWIPMKDKYLTPAGRLWLDISSRLRKSDGRHTHNSFLYHVGNGGLSLRRTGRFLELVGKYRDKIQADLSDDSKLYPEDLWLHYELKGQDRLSVPSWKEALGFAFEQNPETSFRLNGGRLPFGCHAWYHPDYREFWKTYIF